MARASRSTIGSMLSFLVVVSVAILPLLPTAHSHPAGIEGRTQPLVHAHAWQAAVPAGTMSFESSHDDHVLATSLSGRFVAGSGFAAHALPFVIAAAAIPLVKHRVGVARISQSERIHAPPSTPWSVRGPPVRS